MPEMLLIRDGEKDQQVLPRAFDLLYIAGVAILSEIITYKQLNKNKQIVARTKICSVVFLNKF